MNACLFSGAMVVIEMSRSFCSYSEFIGHLIEEERDIDILAFQQDSIQVVTGDLEEFSTSDSSRSALESAMPGEFGALLTRQIG